MTNELRASKKLRQNGANNVALLYADVRLCRKAKNADGHFG